MTQGSLPNRSPLRLSDAIGGRDNNLNLIRMIAAFLVLVSHAAAITTGRPEDEPLRAATGHSLGHLAVVVFFAVSGLLITRSFDRRQTLSRFVWARVLRLWPALILFSIVTAYVIGPLTTTLPPGAYLAAVATHTYLPRTVGMAFPQFALPGVFTSLPIEAVNGSLWTLRYEVACYILVAVAGLLGVLVRPRLFLSFYAVLSLAFVAILLVEPSGGSARALANLVDLGWVFASGAALYLMRDRVALDGRLVAVLAVLSGFSSAALGPGLATTLLVYGTAIYGAIWLAFVPKGMVRRYNRLGDYSYGFYLAAFPIQQVAMLHGAATPLANIAVATPLTLAWAVLSWHIVEKPALALVRRRAAQPLQGSLTAPSR